MGAPMARMVPSVIPDLCVSVYVCVCVVRGRISMGLRLCVGHECACVRMLFRHGMSIDRVVCMYGEGVCD